MVGVTTVEVAAAKAATVEAATGCGFGSMAHKWDGLHVGEGSGDDGSDVAAIVLSGRDEKEKTKKTYLNVIGQGWVRLQLLGLRQSW